MLRLKIVFAILTATLFMVAAQQPPAQQPPAQQPPAQQPAPQPPQTLPQQPSAPLGNLSLQNASLTEVIDQLARLLHINYIIDPTLKGSVVLNTYGDTRNIDARNLLELILRINGAGMIQVGDLYRIVPLKDIARQPLKPEQGTAKTIPEDDQTMLNLVFLKYVTVDELTKVLTEFTGENARIYSYTPANLLFILDSHRNMRRTMELISLFDSDAFANQRVRLFEVKNARPSDVVKELESILRSISLDTKTSPVRFLPVDRINTLIAVAPNPGVFNTVEQWLKKLDIPVKITAGATENYVYRVRYGRADCLAIALSQLFGFGGAGAYGGYGGYSGYGGYGAAPYGGMVPGVYGASPYGGYSNTGYGPGVLGNSTGAGGYGTNSFGSGFGGTGACGGGIGGLGGYGGSPYGGGTPGYGYPAFGGYTAQAPVPGATGQPLMAAAPASAVSGATAGGPAATTSEIQPRIVPNPLDNALIIQADAQQYQNILKILKDLDIPPRQILLEAKIYSVDLRDGFSSGVSALFQRVSGKDRGFLGQLASDANGVLTTSLQAGMLVGKSRELLAFLNLSENRTHAHVISEPSLIATDSIPAAINVGTQVPITTGQTTIPAGGNVAVAQTFSSRATGVTMQVNARVNPSGVVTLMINQEVSTPTATTTSSIQTPSFSQQVVQTQITLQDGDTIAIGGIIKDDVTSTTSGIPGLNRLPGIGVLFGNKAYNHARSELIIFMTPHVIYDETNLLEASDELKARIKYLRKYVKDL